MGRKIHIMGLRSVQEEGLGALDSRLGIGVPLRV